MVISSNCKINIGLNVVAKRKDGFHDIETMMYPVNGLCDVLEIIESDKDGIEFESSGLKLECKPENNLCIKTYNLMKEHFPDKIGGIKMHLHKVIPSGAGLGGGSSNAASMIKALNEMFSLGLTPANQEKLASAIGSDTPFFIKNRPMFAAGRGELLYPAYVSLKGYKLVIVKPNVSVSTAEAYHNVTASVPEHPLSRLLKHPIEMWRGLIKNDFEEVIFPKFPAIQAAKKMLYQSGAVYAAMSGSGSAVYGIFYPDTKLAIDITDVFVYEEVMD